MCAVAVTQQSSAQGDVMSAWVEVCSCAATRAVLLQRVVSSLRGEGIGEPWAPIRGEGGTGEIGDNNNQYSYWGLGCGGRDDTN